MGRAEISAPFYCNLLLTSFPYNDLRAGGLPEFIFANEILFHDRNISHILFVNENGNHDVIVIRSEIAVNVHGVYVATFQLGVKPAIFFYRVFGFCRKRSGSFAGTKSSSILSSLSSLLEL